MSSGAPDAASPPPATGPEPRTASPGTSPAAAIQRSREGLASVIAVGLIARMRGGERVEPQAFGMDADDRRVGAQVELVALGIDHLRHQRDFGERRPVAMAEPG